MRSAAPTCTIPSSPAGGSVRTADSDAAAAAAAAVFSQRSLVSEPWAAAALSSAGQATPEPVAVKQAPVQCGPVGLAAPGPGETARPAVRRPAATRPRASRSVSPSESEARRRGAPLPPLQLASVVPVPSTSLSPAAAPDSDVQEQRSREAPVGYESDHPPMGKTDSDGPPAFLPALALGMSALARPSTCGSPGARSCVRARAPARGNVCAQRGSLRALGAFVFRKRAVQGGTSALCRQRCRSVGFRAPVRLPSVPAELPGGEPP